MGPAKDRQVMDLRSRPLDAVEGCRRSLELSLCLDDVAIDGELESEVPP
jgi:hypothetical protein